MAQNENQTDDLDIDDLVGDEAEKNRLGFSGAKIGRFVAVAFFLLLGTFAVIHSMNRNAGDKPHEHAGLEGGDGTATDGASSVVNSVGLMGQRAASKFTAASPPAQPLSPTVDATKIALSTRPKAEAANKTSFPPANSLPKPAITSKGGFSGFKPPTMPQSLQAKGQQQPVVRLAQAPGKPIIPSTQGFGELKKKPFATQGFGAPKVTAKPIASSSVPGRFAPLPTKQVSGGSGFAGIAASRDSLIKKSGNEAKKLLGELSGGASGLRNNASRSIGAAKESLGGLVEQASDRFGSAKPKLGGGGSQFGGGGFSKPPAKNTADRFAPPARQPLAPSKSNNVFGASVKKQGGFGEPSKQPTNFGTRSSTLGGASLRGSGSTMRSPQTEATNSARRLPSRPVSTGAAQVGSGRSEMVAAPLANGGGVRSLVGASSPAARTASAVTSDVPGDKRLDGVQSPSLTIEKFSPREIQVNQPSDFQIVIRNVGRVPVDNVQVFDRVPVGTEFLEATPKPTQVSNRQLSWMVGTVEPGTEKRINLKLKPTKPGEIGSVAQMTFATRSSMRTRVTQPVLEVTHRTKPQVLVGDDVMIDVVVTNRGDGPAQNVLIQEDVPEQLDFRDGYREIEYEVGTLMPNQSRNIRLALRAKNPGKLENVIFATGSGGLKSQHKLNMEVVAPKLKAKADGPTRRFLGRRAQHQFSVSNNGTAAATNVDLIARLPSGLRYVNSNNKGTYDPNNHSVFWELAELQRGVTADVEIATEPVAIGSQPIKFEVNADLNMADKVEQPLSVEHLVDVFFDIDDVVDPIEIGSETRYRIQVVNQGTKAATNVRLTVDFPPGLKPTSVDGPLANRITGQQILFSPIGSLKPGERVQFLVNGAGQAAGDHRVVLKMQTDGRTAAVSKEETTRVYSDR